MNFEEFMRPREIDSRTMQAKRTTPRPVEPEEPEELDVQKVVVEELAADKAKQDEEIAALRAKVEQMETERSAQGAEIAALKASMVLKDAEIAKSSDELAQMSAANSSLHVELAQVRAELDAEKSKEIDLQERNPNALALLDRDVDLPDRFPGETRDQVLEVVREAREKAEAEGRIRRAQVLEGVLVANEPNGNLAKKRAALEKFFSDNGNILSGTVIAELERCGISHKKGDQYLLPSEILLRTY